MIMIMIKVTISGCTGFSNRYSRKILWLEVGPSNNNPAIVAKYFVDALGVVEGNLSLLWVNSTPVKYTSEVEKGEVWFLRTVFFHLST